MPCRGKKPYGMNIVGKHKLPAKGTVKDKVKCTRRMFPDNPFKALIGEPTYAFKLPGQQQPGVYSDFQNKVINSVNKLK